MRDFHLDLDLHPDPISRLDDRRRVVWQNVSCRGWRDDGAGEACWRVHFGREEPCEGCLAQEVLDTGQVRRWFVATEGEDGAAAYYEITALPLEAEGDAPRGLVEIIRDRTLNFSVEHGLIRSAERLEQRAQEAREQLEAVEKHQARLVQEEKMATLGRLAAGLTHEMHTPLGTIVSTRETAMRLLEAAGREDSAVDSGELRGLLELQKLALDRVGSLLESLRHFARLDQAPWEWVDLHTGLEACLQLLSHELRGRIRVERDFGRLPVVRCRAEAIHQVFMNLLQNAVQSMSGRGVLRVRTRPREDGRVSVVVEDDGRGIPEELLEKIFEPGFTTKPRGVGTGLGLAMTRATVDLHGGSVEVESTPGKGSRFTVLLPIGGPA